MLLYLAGPAVQDILETLSDTGEANILRLHMRNSQNILVKRKM